MHFFLAKLLLVCQVASPASNEALLGQLTSESKAQQSALELISRPRSDVLPLLIQSLQSTGYLSNSEDGRYWAYHVLTTYTDETSSGLREYSDPSVVTQLVLGLQDSGEPTRQDCARALVWVDAPHTAVAVHALIQALADFSEPPLVLAVYMQALESMGARAADALAPLLSWLKNPSGAHLEYWNRIRTDNEDGGLFGDNEILVRRRAAFARLALGVLPPAEIALYDSLDARGRSAATSALASYAIKNARGLSVGAGQTNSVAAMAALQLASLRLARSVADAELSDSCAKDAAYALAIVHGLGSHSSNTVQQMSQILATVSPNNESRFAIVEALRAILVQ